MIKQFINELKQTTMAQAVRGVSGIFASLMLVWSFGGQFVKPYIGEAIAQVMTEQGVSPKDFKEALNDIESIQKSLIELHNVTTKRDRQIDILLTNQSAVIAQNQQTKEKLNDTNNKLDQIIQAIIRKQFGQIEAGKP